MGKVRVITLGNGHGGHCLSSAWNVSWNGLLAYLSAASAISAVNRAISAASARAA